MTSAPWTPPWTYNPLYSVPSANLNTYLRDNTTFLYSPPTAKAHKTADIGIPAATWTVTAMGTAEWDTDGITNLGTGTFTIQTAGVYWCTATCRFDIPNTNGVRGLRLNHNSGTIIAANTIPASTVLGDITVSGARNFQAGDTLIAEVYQNSGGTISLLGSVFPIGYSLAVAWVGAGT